MGYPAFNKTGEVSLVFAVAPRYPCRVSLVSGFVSAETEGGEEYAYGKGSSYALLELKFEGLPAADFDGGYNYAANAQAAGTQSLVNWFYNVFSPSRAAFTYTDPFGKGHTVTIEGDRLDFTETNYGLYDGTIILKERLG